MNGWRRNGQHGSVAPWPSVLRPTTESQSPDNTWRRGKWAWYMNSRIPVQIFRYSGILLHYSLWNGNAATVTLRNKNWTEKDSNKKINTKTDNKAEDNKTKRKEKLLTSPESSLRVRVCVVCLRKKKRYIMDIGKEWKTDFFLCVCALFKMGILKSVTVSRQKEKRIRNQNFRGGRTVMLMFPFLFFFFFSCSVELWLRSLMKVAKRQVSISQRTWQI